MKDVKPDPYQLPMCKNKLKMDLRPNVRTEPRKCQKKTGRTLHDIGMGKNVLFQTPQNTENKGKNRQIKFY